MSYLQRAQSMHERGEFVRAAILLADGLRRSPGDEEALQQLLDVYLRDISTPGIEKEILQALERQPDGLDLYDLIERQLDAAGDLRRIEALRKTREYLGVLVEPDPYVAPAPADPSAGYAATPSRHADGAGRHSGHGGHAAPVPEEPAQFQTDNYTAATDPPSPRPSEPPTSRVSRPQGPAAPRLPDVAAAPQASPATRPPAPSGLAAHAAHPNTAHANTAHANTAHAAPQSHQAGQHRPEDPPTMPGSRAATGQREYAWDRFSNPIATTDGQEYDELGQETATTGVFSSVDAYLEQQSSADQEHDRFLLRRRRLLLGLVAISAVAILLVFARPSGEHSPDGGGLMELHADEGDVPLLRAVPAGTTRAPRRAVDVNAQPADGPSPSPATGASEDDAPADNLPDDNAPPSSGNAQEENRMP